MYSPYNIGQHIKAVVEQVLPFGVFVRLDDGTRAYIRRRELDLDADVDPAQVAREGDRITAEIISLSEPGRHIELSRRKSLPDPWLGFARQFREGDVVHGTVQALHPRGAFIRVVAGVNGFVPLEELATWQVEKPEQVLWEGDDVEAVITHLDVRDKKLWLSIKARMEKRNLAVKIVQDLEEKRTAETAPTPVPQIPKEEFEKIGPAERARVGRIVVLDDEDDLRSGFVKWLQQGSFEAVAVGTVLEAQAEIQQTNAGVVFVDLNLPDGDGMQLVLRLRTQNSRLHVCIMSSPEWLSERVTEIEEVGVTQVFQKPLDREEIDRFLLRLARGERISAVWRATPQRASAEIATLHEFLAAPSRDTSPTLRLQKAMEKVVETADAEKGVLFAIDPTSRAITVIIEAGTLALNQEAVYELEHTPVKDVMVQNEPVWTGQATREPRFRKLLDRLAFESCIGVPIEVMGEVDNAVFFFHRRKDAFSFSRLPAAAGGVLQLGALLEAQALDQRIRAASPLLLSGELALSLAHEVSNKISSLEFDLFSSITDGQASPANLRAALLDLKTVAASFHQMMRAKDVPAPFDVNAVVRHAEMLLRSQARKQGVKMSVRLADNLPPATGNEIAVQQVFLNIMLNAIQQMTLRQDGHRLLEITTAHEGDRCKHPIKVRFKDTGPGIHKQLWEKIFALGFSTRGGSGLGLYIARSLVDSLGSKIAVEESFVPVGTTFLVELLAADHGGTE
ncbi:MAG: S1 RNA-binding domain-containing protein [Chloroflexi bacterium]|nr:S1 RNA-binding domain-containing protein [Chloroflexota bacterium]